jgi:hypothetical protein
MNPAHGNLIAVWKTLVDQECSDLIGWIRSITERIMRGNYKKEPLHMDVLLKGSLTIFLLNSYDMIRTKKIEVILRALFKYTFARLGLRTNSASQVVRKKPGQTTCEFYRNIAPVSKEKVYVVQVELVDYNGSIPSQFEPSHGYWIQGLHNSA